MSSGHVVRERFKISLTYYGHILFGKMVQVTDVKAAKTISPVLMGMSVKQKLEKWI